MVVIINPISIVEAGESLAALFEMGFSKKDKLLYDLGALIVAISTLASVFVLPITIAYKKNSMIDKKVAYSQQLQKEPKEYETKRVFGEILEKEEYSLADVKRTKFLGLRELGQEELLGIYGLEIIKVKDDDRVYKVINTKTPLNNTKGNKINIEYKIFPMGRISLQELAMESYKMPPERAANLADRVIEADGWY